MLIEAQRLSAFARIPLGLAELVVEEAYGQGFGVKSLRAEGKPNDMVKCRRLIAARAKEQGFSISAIARALNRDRATVRNALSIKNEKSVDEFRVCSSEYDRIAA